MTGDDAWLSALRTVGDPPADAYVAERLGQAVFDDWSLDLTTALFCA